VNEHFTGIVVIEVTILKTVAFWVKEEDKRMVD